MIAVVGLGSIGEPVAANLLKTGQVVGVAPHRSRGAVDRLVATGAMEYASISELLGDAELVFIALPDGAVIEAVLPELSDGAAVEEVVTSVPWPQGVTIFDLSTIGAEESAAIGADLSRRGVRYVDAPVSGGHNGAVAGTLTIMIGGAKEEFADLEPLLNAIGKKLFYCGRRGQGTAAKLANNLLVGVQLAALREALALSENLGLADATLLEIVGSSSGNSTILQAKMSAILERDFSPSFSLELMHKDLRLAVEALRSTRRKDSVAAEALSTFEACLKDWGGSDCAAVTRCL